VKQELVRIGIDIGGTFTDFVLYYPSQSQINCFKILSSPADPSQAVLQGLRKLGFLDQELPEKLSAQVENIIHGSTVATNALLERKGAVTALITTQGFADVLEIGRQNRPSLYDLMQELPAPLVPSDLRYEVSERVTTNGEIIKPLDPTEIGHILPDLKSRQVESVAVCLLFSFSYPNHETVIASTLRKAGYPVSVSSEILPEYREYERTSTTVINAYVSPVLEKYLAKLNLAWIAPSRDRSFHIMQSNGGVISIPEAQKNAVRCILSGPAGGVVGSQFIGNTALVTGEKLRLITFDMGGTSTDVSVIDQSPMITTEFSISGYPIGIPVLDIHTIGSGGGSIAYVDPGGALRVGPQSAGADPGPACYGRIDLTQDSPSIFPTVTDANLVLGRISAKNFLGGRMPLRPDLAEFAIQQLSQETGLSMMETALGIISVANTHMARALRVISVERGHDPRDFTMLSFGGAGGLHATDLARKLTIPRILIPPYASTLSALGMLAADLIKDYSKTVMLPGNATLETLTRFLTPMITQAKKELQDEKIPPELVTFDPSLDMRYLGQSYELTIPLLPGRDFISDFHMAHKKAYGYQRETVPASQIEIVNIRLRATGQVSRPELPPLPIGEADSSPALVGRRKVILESGEPKQVPFYNGEDLTPGNRLNGPAVIIRPDTTIFLGGKDEVEVDPYLNLLITVSF
jgi:N-methylhydantoinase A